ncbi:hypothetical protein ACFL6Y_05710, partial [Elusimicrobiota bacterium]
DPFSVSSGPVNYLQVKLENTPPSNPAVINGSGAKLTRAATEILKWSHSEDPEGDTITYTVFAGTEAASTKPAAQNISETSFSLDGISFGTTYYWQVRAEDSFGDWAYSPTVSFIHEFLNTGPSQPQILGQALRGIHVEAPFADTICWSMSSDLESDTITYTVFIGTSPWDLSPTIQTKDTRWDAKGLDYNTTYYGQVMALDDYGLESKSPLFSWSYHLVNEPLASPIYLSTGGVRVTRLTSYPVIWQAAADPEGDDLAYSLLSGTDPLNLSTIAHGDILQAELTDLAFDTTYYFKALVRDSFGAMTEGATQKVRLVFENKPPASPLYTSPMDVIVTRNPDYVLTWNAGEDPDGDPVNYKVLHGVDPQNPEIALTKETSLALTELAWNTTYYFQTIAHDPYGGVSSAAIVSIYLTFKNSSPEPMTDISNFKPPLSGEIETDKNSITINWPAYSDPDGDPVTYVLYLKNGAGAIQTANLAGNTFSKAIYKGTSNSYALSNLKFYSTYTYLIEIRDVHGAAIAGPSGFFTLVPRSAQNEPYNYPNPFRVNDGTTFVITAIEPIGSANISVYSVYQDLVWEKSFGPLGIGVHHIHWDGNDSNGRPVFSGLYIAVIDTSKTRKTARMVAIR